MPPVVSMLYANLFNLTQNKREKESKKAKRVAMDLCKSLLGKHLCSFHVKLGSFCIFW